MGDQITTCYHPKNEASRSSWFHRGFSAKNAVEAHPKYSADIHHPIFPPPEPPRPLHRPAALPCLPVLLLIRQDLLAVALGLLALGFSIWLGRSWQGINKP